MEKKEFPNLLKVKINKIRRIELMSKWRPSKDGCVYVIPDIHGRIYLLEIILARILPLRKNDKIIFLGDYIDRHTDSYKVVDRIINLIEEYEDQIICLMGNHELMLLQGLEFIPVPSLEFANSCFQTWCSNGGYATVAGYLERSGLNIDPCNFAKNRLKIRKLIPSSHLDFYKNLLPFYETERFIFVHGGCHPTKSPSNYSIDTLVWDRSLFNLVISLIELNKPLSWDKIIITGHNGRGSPVIKDKFLMLDFGNSKKLLVVELNTMKAFLAQSGITKLVKFELKETLSSKSGSIV